MSEFKYSKNYIVPTDKQAKKIDTDFKNRGLEKVVFFLDCDDLDLNSVLSDKDYQKYNSIDNYLYSVLNISSRRLTKSELKILSDKIGYIDSDNIRFLYLATRGSLDTLIGLISKFNHSIKLSNEERRQEYEPGYNQLVLLDPELRFVPLTKPDLNSVKDFHISDLLIKINTADNY